MHPSVAVVILNWNGRTHLETYLPSVIKHSVGADIYLADNGSTDDSVDFVKENFPEVKHIQNTENYGFAKGYNQALKSLKQDYFILLNSDVEVTDNWISPLIELMENRKEIAIAQPKIKDYQRKSSFEYAGAGGGLIDELGYPFCRGRIFDSLEEDTGQYDDETEVFWASGACMFIKSDVFRHFKGFDPNYFAHMEEIDLCWRVKNQGFSVYYSGKSTVYHLGGGTMKNSNPRKTYLNFRNSLITLYKNDQSKYRLVKVLIRLILDAPAFLKLGFSSGLAHAMAIIKAHYAFFRIRKQWLKAEKPNQKGIYKSSIVMQYYLFKKKKFNQLKYGFN